MKYGLMVLGCLLLGGCLWDRTSPEMTALRELLKEETRLHVQQLTSMCLIDLGQEKITDQNRELIYDCTSYRYRKDPDAYEATKQYQAIIHAIYYQSLHH